MASTPVRRAPHSEELLVKAYTTQEYPPRAIPRNRGDSVTSSASRRGPPAQQKPSGRPARRGQVTVVGGGQHVACYCPQCLAAAGLSKLDGKRTPNWHQSSPYLEDLTKSLVISQPARRKVHLVPPRRAHAAASPYETSLPTRAAPKLRTQVQTELAERTLRRLLEMEAAAAAERCGVDLNTYTTLLELQHRDITPEDYDTLQLLDSANKPKTLSQSLLDAKFPVWTVPEAEA
ncbi:hypothetical protein Ctob_014212 [Chrysochromulina tobinii]|uniref:Uncharacterized protein n=1 Tax=Chrysochromulina tobinii TaxID=1460289 RepID=A0A0M0LP20_9EUKA|nr:hypothetical protein Ctob_014212 [Chrysochromulina tobinii]|eukprot:KOO52825.1 hypothetical protein Ctob_014212 [Chrysochromulina sp. CCMP291]